MISRERLKMMAIQQPGAYASYAAVLRAKKAYPGVTRWSVDHSGPEPVARPARLSPVERQQQQLARRLYEIAQQEHAYLSSRLRTISYG